MKTMMTDITHGYPSEESLYLKGDGNEEVTVPLDRSK